MTTTSRRALLGGTALGLVGGPIATSGAASAAAKPRRRSLYSRSRFVPLRHRAFKLSDGQRSWWVTLTRVSDLSSSLANDDRSFGLTFRSRGQGPAQGTYVLRRRGFRSTTLFVVPDPRHRSYQAIVNAAPLPRR